MNFAYESVNMMLFVGALFQLNQIYNTEVMKQVEYMLFCGIIGTVKSYHSSLPL